MKITHLKLGQAGTSISSKRHVTICAELDGPHEFMTMTVRVPNSGSEGANTESHERKISQEVSRTCPRPFFLDNARAIGSFCISCVISSDLRLIV